MERDICRKQIGANRRLANAKSSMLHPGEQSERRMRMYVLTCLLFVFPLLICAYERAQHRRNNEKNERRTGKFQKEKKNPVPSDV